MIPSAPGPSISSVDGIALDACLHQPANVPPGVGVVLLAHGVTADLDEGGMFFRLAEGLTAQGFTVLRFSFRGHGRSGGTQRGVTIAGEMLDLEAAASWLRGQDPGPLSVVAASFGAVSVLSAMPWLEAELTGLVLWNPILDLRRTFLEPELPWGLDNFGSAALQRLWAEGSLLVDGTFELGRALFTEFAQYDLSRRFVDSRTPALVVHGDQDAYVSYDIARAAAETRPACDFHAVVGSDHGFDSREREDEAIEVTVSWLAKLHEGL